MGFLNNFADLFVERNEKLDPQEAARREAARHTVLVIDDDKEFLETCTQMLRDAGYNVLKCSNGPKGLNMLRYAPKNISCVLLDYDMPQFNGGETLDYARKISPQIRVGAVSGLDRNLLPVNFRDTVDQFLPKPFASDQLLQFVRGLVMVPLPAEPEVAAPAPAAA
jgi:CheY-like chemotaxis protein